MANVITNPTGDQTIGSHNLLPASGNPTQQSLGSASAPWYAVLELESVNATVVFANNFPGADLGAQINAADTALGSAPGVIVVTSSGTVSTSVSLGQYHDLVGAGQNVSLNLSGTANIVLSGSNTSVCNLTINSASTATSVITATSVSELRVEDIIFIGGQNHISLTGCLNFRISRTTHQSITQASGNVGCILLSGCDHGSVESTRVENFLMPSGGTSYHLIYLYPNGSTACSDISVINPVIRAVDNSNNGGGAGVSFTGAALCSLTGGIITNLINMDGVLCENGSSYIAITGTISHGHTSALGAGTGQANGDGFDIFNSSHITLTGCQAYRDGLTNNSNCGFEVFNCYDVNLSNCIAVNCGLHGFQLLGTPFVKMTNCTSNFNGGNGINVQGSSSGTGLGTSNSGTVNTSGTTSVTWASGVQFNLAWPSGTKMHINGVQYAISTVNSATSITLTTSAGTHTGSAYYTDLWITWVGGIATWGWNWEPGTVINISGTNYVIASSPVIDSLAATGAIMLTTSPGSLANASYDVSTYNFSIVGCQTESNGQGFSVTTYQSGIQVSDYGNGLITQCVSNDNQASQMQVYGCYIGPNARAILLFNLFTGNGGPSVEDVGLVSPQISDVAGKAQWVSKGVINSQNSIYGAQMVVTDVTPTTLASGQVGFGNNTGFGNGAPGTAVTTKARGTGAGPTNPQTVIGYLEINVGGTPAWIPYCA